MRNFQTTLRRLWKGTLYVAITSTYIAIIGLLFLFEGWLFALIAFALIVLTQFFRYITNAVDRVGWIISNKADVTDEEKSTASYQKRLLALMIVLVHLCNVGLLYQAYVYVGITWSIWTLCAIVFIEAMFLNIRAVNRKIQYEHASYGVDDLGIFDMRPASSGATTSAKETRLDEQLKTLEDLAERGKISRKSYEKTRDRLRIKLVLEDTEGR